MSLGRFFLLAILLLVSACNPLIPPKSSPPQLPDHYRGVSDRPISAVPELWWTAFSDSRLNQLQQEMLADNLDLRQALFRLEQLEALQRSSGSSLWPTLNLNAAASKERTPNSSGSSTTESGRVSLAAGYEIDLWNRLHDTSKAAELRLQAGEQETQTLLLSLTAQLAENYFLAVEQQLRIELLQQQLEQNRKLLATANERYRSGLTTAEEIYRVQRSIAANLATLPRLQTALNQAKLSLQLLLGRTPDADFLIGNQLPTLKELGDSSFPANLLSNRPDIAAAFYELQATDHELAAALANRLPSFNLSGSIGHSSTRLASGDINGAFWSLTGSLFQPLIDGGRRKAESDRQQAVRNAQAVKMQQTLLTAIQEVEGALYADQNHALRTYQLVEQRNISQRILELSRSNYLAGLIDSRDLLEDEISHLTILMDEVSAQREWLSNRISLARALGGQWMTAELEKQQQALKDTRTEQ